MKTATLLIFVLSVGYASGQIVPSSCDADDAILDLYQSDADHLALKHIYDSQSIYADSFDIPTSISDTFMGALIAVYNLSTVPARDSVVDMYNIHHYSDEKLNGFYLYADSSLPWMMNLQGNVSPTGNAIIDEAMLDAGFTLEEYDDRFGLLVNDRASFKSTINYNIKPMTDSLALDSGVSSANLAETYGGGSPISAIVQPTYIDLTYTYGWGDCPSGCIWSHNWHFRVYYDCGVEYMGSSGEPIWTVGITDPNQAAVKLFPNPTVNVLSIEGLEGNFQYQIMNAKGELAQAGTSETQQVDVSGLAKGSYLIILDEGNAAPLSLGFIKSAE